MWWADKTPWAEKTLKEAGLHGRSYQVRRPARHGTTRSPSARGVLAQAPRGHYERSSDAIGDFNNRHYKMNDIEGGPMHTQLLCMEKRRTEYEAKLQQHPYHQKREESATVISNRLRRKKEDEERREAAFARAGRKRDHFIRAFKMFDIDQDGTISLDELMAIVCHNPKCAPPHG